MQELVTLSEGEVHAHTHREFIGLDEDGPVIRRGASIRLYTLDEASQGEPLRLDVKGYLDHARENSRAFAHRERRAGFQRSAPQNNFRRLIAAIIPPGEFCFDTIKFVPESASSIDLDFLVALLNSTVMDWYFRLGSTNSKVNEYQFNVLPIPSLSPPEALSSKGENYFQERKWDDLALLLNSKTTHPGTMSVSVAEVIAAMSRTIQSIEQERVIKGRSERAKLSPESQPIQDAIDAGTVQVLRTVG